MRLSDRTRKLLGGMLEEALGTISANTLWHWLEKSNPGEFEAERTAKGVGEDARKLAIGSPHERRA